MPNSFLGSPALASVQSGHSPSGGMSTRAKRLDRNEGEGLLVGGIGSLGPPSFKSIFGWFLSGIKSLFHPPLSVGRAFPSHRTAPFYAGQPARRGASPGSGLTVLCQL